MVELIYPRRELLHSSPRVKPLPGREPEFGGSLSDVRPSPALMNSMLESRLFSAVRALVIGKRDRLSITHTLTPLRESFLEERVRFRLSATHTPTQLRDNFPEERVRFPNQGTRASRVDEHLRRLSSLFSSFSTSSLFPLFSPPGQPPS